ncbi:MAG: ROK family protein [Acidobacteria bacterium]|nr:ROK family protein [Acidobacteriota bacterium]
MRTLAIDIGGTKFTIALFDGERMIQRVSEATNRDGGPDWMLGRVAAIAESWRFDRCGVGFGGPVLFDAQRVALSTHVGGWSGFELGAVLRDRLKVPVIIDNDANVGALGEARAGAARGLDPVFYMTLSTGIGGGIVSQGRIYRGADSYAGEIGHTTVVPDGPECLCGARGCLERMCCGLWLERDHGIPARELLTDPSFVERYVVLLARGLKTIIMLLNPARLVVGGGIGKAGPALFDPLRAELRRQITSWSRARIDVVPAALADDSVLHGALALTEEIS